MRIRYSPLILEPDSPHRHFTLAVGSEDMGPINRIVDLPEVERTVIALGNLRKIGGLNGEERPHHAIALARLAMARGTVFDVDVVTVLDNALVQLGRRRPPSSAVSAHLGAMIMIAPTMPPKSKATMPPRITRRPMTMLPPCAKSMP